MTTRLAISGFGRIGRMVLRAFVESGRGDVEIVLINTPGAVEASAHLYEFDSVHGRAKGGITFGEGWMDVGTGRIAMTHERDPAAIPHGEHGVDVHQSVVVAAQFVIAGLDAAPPFPFFWFGYF